MKKQLRALILEDTESDVILLLRELRRGGFDVDYIVVDNANAMKAALEDRGWDVILSDYSMPGFDALAALSVVHAMGQDIPFIIISGTIGEDAAVAAMKAGARDFFAKDKLTRLVPAVERELREAEARQKGREAEARFYKAFHTSPVGIVISRLADGKVLDINQRFTEMFDYRPEDIIGKRGADIQFWGKPEQRETIVGLLRETRSVQNFEVEWQGTSGQIGYALLSAAIIELNNEPCILSMVHDITARRTAEVALEERGRQFRLLAENSTDIISRHTPDGLYVYTSPACKILLGYEPDDMVGRSVYDFLHPDDRDELIKAHQIILGTSDTYTVAYRIRRKDNNYMWFETTNRSIRDPETNATTEIQTVSRDITERKESEQSLKHYAQRLELLHEIDQAILRADQPQTIAEAVLIHLHSLTHYHSASVTLFDLDQRQFRVLVTTAPIPGQLAQGTQHPFESNDVIDVLQRNEIYIVDDLLKMSQLTHSDQALVKAGVRAYARIPLISSNKLLGSINFRAEKPHTFSIENLEIAREVAAQLAIAIENARLLEIERRRNSELTALHQASLQLTRTLNLEIVLETIIDYAILLIQASDAHIFLYDGKTLTFGLAQWGGKKQDVPLAQPRHQGLTYTVARSGQRLVIPNMGDHPTYENTRWKGAIIGLPLSIASEVKGVMSLAFDEPHQFDEHEIRLLELLADQAAIAIHNAQLYLQIQSHAETLEQRVFERTQELQQAKDRVEAILNSSSDAILLADADGKIVQTNPGFHVQLGYAPDTVFGQPLLSLVTVKYAERLNEALQEVIQNRTYKRIEITAQRQDQSIFPADALIFSFIEGGRIGIVCSLRDITLQKQVEGELREALEKEKELNDLKSNFTSIVSHEFRTPLAVIQSSVETLIHYFDRIDADRRLQKLQNIRQQVQRLAALMNDVLTITRSESIGFEFKPQHIDLVKLCEEIIEEVQVGQTNDVSIDFIHHGNCSIAYIDEVLFRHILQNLISNAVKYSINGGKVRIQLNCIDDALTLQVEDQGIGIPKQHQSKLFESFQRAANVGQVQGTGIGLTIVKRAVDAHAGVIKFESVEGKGTTFVVNLPAK